MDARHRWLTPAGLAVIGLVVLANAGSSVGLGTSGKALLITIGVAVYAAAALVFLLWSSAPVWVNVVLLLTMAGASVAAHHGDPTGTGGIGLYLGMAFAPMRLDLRSAAVVCVASVLAFNVQLVLEADNALVFAAVVDGGAAFFFLLGTLLRAEHEQRTRADGLVVQLEESRAAEKAAAADFERARLAREMHDLLTHTLSGLVLQLEGARLLAHADGSHGELADVIDRAYGLARGGLVEARQAVLTLRRDGDLPGPDRLRELVAEQAQVPGAGSYQFREVGTRTELAPEASLAMYRTAQEALSNIRKHAPGADVLVTLTWSASGARLEVADSGGAAHQVLDASGAGYGLSGLEERARLLGGTLTVSRANPGFAVALQVPVPREAPS
jgi:signal transduction histidine kinase